MALVDTYKGVFTTPASTGSDTITGIGFTPKAVLFWGVPVTSEAVAVHAAQWIGMSDGTNHRVIMCAGENGAQDTRRDINESACVSILNADSDTPVAVASITGFADGEFTLNYTSTSAGYLCHYIAFGGSELDCVVGQVTASAGTVTGLSFRPKLVICMSAGLATGGAASQHAIQGFGCFDDAATPNQWWVASFQGANAADQGNKDSVLLSTGFVGQLYQAALTWEASITTVNNDGWSWSGSNADGFYYLAFDLGSNVDCVVGGFTKSNNTSTPVNQDLPDLGFTPQIYMLATGCETNQVATSPNGTRVSLGAYDGANQGLTFRTDVNSATNADQRSNDDNVLGTGTADAVFNSLATAQPITDSTPTITWDPNNDQQYFIGYWAIESAVTYELTGFTKRNSTSAVIGDCECYLFKDNGDNTLTWLQQTTSDSVTGAWTFTDIADNDPSYLVIAWKDETPHIFDVTDHILQPEETATVSTDLCLWSDAEKGEVSVDNDLRLRRLIDKCPNVPNTTFFSMLF